MRPNEPTIDREFARIDVELRARVQPLDAVRAARLAAEAAERPSVWAPASLAALRDLAAGSAPGPSATLAQAILEIAGEVARLRARAADGPSPVQEATIVQLSGGGGRLLCAFPLAIDDLIELRLDDDDPAVPPLRVLARVVHRADDGSGVGFAFEALHPRDHDLVMRLIYGLQRRSLRARQG
jgi:hypothetical protein